MNLALLCSSTAPTTTYSIPTSPVPLSHTWCPPSPGGDPRRHPPPPPNVQAHITGTPVSPRNSCLPPFSPPVDAQTAHSHPPLRYPQQSQYSRALPPELAGYSETSVMHPNDRRRWLAPQYKPDQHAYPSYAPRHLEDRSVHPNSAGQGQSYPFYAPPGNYTPPAQYSYAQYDTRANNFQQQVYPSGVPPPLPTPASPSEGSIFPNINEVSSRPTVLQTDLEKVSENCATIARFAADHLEAIRSQHGSHLSLPPELLRKMCGCAYDILRTLLSLGGTTAEAHRLIPVVAKSNEGDHGDVGSENGESSRDVYSDLKPRSKYRKRNKRTAPPAPGRCHSCNISETPEWRRGPDGARTLCNACGLHFAKLTRKRALAEQKSAELKRLERSSKQDATSSIEGSSTHLDQMGRGHIASSSSIPSSHDNSLHLPRPESLQGAPFGSEPPHIPDNNSAERSNNRTAELPSVSQVHGDISGSIFTPSTSKSCSINSSYARECSISRDKT